MAQIVIADASPLIAFASIDGLSILQRLFFEVYVTESAKEECSVKPGVDVQRIKAAIEAGWLVVKPGRLQLHPSSPSLGVGESDSIRFALEAPQSSLLIMDDRLARRYALRKGLNIIGTVRLLDLAEKRGVIESAERCIQSMSDFGYRVFSDLLKIVRSEY